MDRPRFLSPVKRGVRHAGGICDTGNMKEMEELGLLRVNPIFIGLRLVLKSIWWIRNTKINYCMANKSLKLTVKGRGIKIVPIIKFKWPRPFTAT